MPGQTYKFLGVNFDVDAAIELSKKRVTNTIEPSKLAGFIPKPQAEMPEGFIAGMNAVDEDYAAKTDNADPIIIATACYENGDTFNLLIDGSHRLFKHLHIQPAESIDYVLLDVEDSLKVASGPLTEFMRKKVGQ